MTQPVQVGIGVLILREQCVLLGERQGSHGAGTWGLPGGHLEYGESIESCAAREVLEETGLRVSAVQQAGFTSTLFEREQKHYVTLFVTATAAAGEAQRREPDKCSRWGWFAWSSLPTPLFAPLAALIEQGYRPPL